MFAAKDPQEETSCGCLSSSCLSREKGVTVSVLLRPRCQREMSRLMGAESLDVGFQPSQSLDVPAAQCLQTLAALGCHSAFRGVDRLVGNSPTAPLARGQEAPAQLAHCRGKICSESFSDNLDPCTGGMSPGERVRVERERNKL